MYASVCFLLETARNHRALRKGVETSQIESHAYLRVVVDGGAVREVRSEVRGEWIARRSRLLEEPPVQDVVGHNGEHAVVDDRSPVVGGVVVVDHPAEVPLQVADEERLQWWQGRLQFESLWWGAWSGGTRGVLTANVTGCDQSPYCEMYAAAPS